MAEIKKGVLGGFSGKVGPIVGVNWRGKNIIRSLPAASKKPPTENQLNQRFKFRAVANFLQPLQGIISKYYGNKTELKSRNNLAVSYMLKNAVSIDDYVAQILYDQVVITKGDLLGFQLLNLDTTSADEFDLTWEVNSPQVNSSPTDLVNFVGYCASNNTYLIHQEIATRETQMATISLPPGMTGKEIEVWMYLNDEKQTQASTSFYVGKYVVR